MARCAAMAFRKAAVSSAAPSPFAPSVRMFTHVAAGGSGTRSEAAGWGIAASGTASIRVSVTGCAPMSAKCRPCEKVRTW